MGPRAERCLPTPSKSTQLKSSGSLWCKQVDESLFNSIVSSNPLRKLKAGLKKDITDCSTTSVNKIPRRSASSLSGDSSRMRQLLEMKEKNKLLQAEAKSLRAAVELSQKSLRDKCDQIEAMDRNINRLMEEITVMEKGPEELERDIDIENLLHANLGDLSIEEIIATVDFTFPADLIELDFPPTNYRVVEPKSQPSSICFSQLKKISNTEAKEAGSAVMDSISGSTPQFEGNRKKLKLNNKVKKSAFRRISQDVKERENTEISVPDHSYLRRKVQFAPSESQFNSQFISCPFCNIIFSRKSQWMLLRHMSDSHKNNVAYPCEYCHKQFTCMSSLTAHKMRHESTDIFQCASCGLKSGDIENFAKHVEYIHGISSYEEAIKILLVNKADT